MTHPEPSEPVSGMLGRLRQSLFVRDAGALWVGELVGLAVGLAQAIVVARFLGPAQYGVAALVVTFPTLVFTLLDPQSQEALVRYLTLFHGREEEAKGAAVVKLSYAADLAVGVVALLVVAASARLAADHIIGDRDTSSLILIASLGVATAAPTATSRGILTTFRRFSSIAVIQIAAALARGVAVVGVVAAGHGVRGYVLAVAVGLVAEGVVAMTIAARVTRSELGQGWRGAPSTDLGPTRREFFRFMAFTDLGSLATVFVKHGDTLVVGAVAGATQAGYYRLARTTGTVAASLVVPLQATLYPRLIAALEAGPRQFRTAVGRSLRQVGLPLCGLLLLATPLVPFGVELLAGRSYRPAAPTAQLYLVGSAFVVLFFWLRPAFLALGRVRFLFVLSAAVSATAAALFYAGAQRSGAFGVALARAAVVNVAFHLVAVVYLLRAETWTLLTDTARDAVPQDQGGPKPR